MKYVRGPLYILLVIGLMSSGCDRKEDDKTSLMLVGAGCLATTPVTMRSITYDMSDQVIAISEQVMQNMMISGSQPDMTSMYEMYGGVELALDIAGYLSDPSDMMKLVTQNPLLTQFWALKKMASSTDAGDDGEWMSPDDTIDPLLGYFETEKVDGRYRMITYSDFGVTPSGRTDFVVEKNRKVKTFEYSAGTDGDFGTDDDEVSRVTLFKYDGDGKMLRAEHYAADETTFQSVYVFSYDSKGRLESMKSYDNTDGTNRLDWGSYSTLTWDDSGDVVKLTIQLGLRIVWLFIPADTPVMYFDYEFNQDGTIHKMIQHEALDPSSIDTCYVYEYSGKGMLARGGINDSSKNYSDNETNQVSYTINELVFGEK